MLASGRVCEGTLPGTISKDSVFSVTYSISESWAGV